MTDTEAGLRHAIAVLQLRLKRLIDMKHSKKHPGFKAVAAKIERKEGVSKKRADAILAASSRHASKAAKKHNPRLKKV